MTKKRNDFLKTEKRRSFRDWRGLRTASAAAPETLFAICFSGGIVFSAFLFQCRTTILSCWGAVFCSLPADVSSGLSVAIAAVFSDPAALSFPVVSLCLLPFVFAERRRRTNIEKTEASVPFFLRAMSENIKSGRPFSDTNAAFRGDDGPRRIRDGLAVGFSFGEVLTEYFGEKADLSGSPVIRQALLITTAAERAGGRVSDALEMAASDVRHAVDEKKEKKERMIPYAVVMALSYLIFTGIVFFITAFFFGRLFDQAESAAAAAGVFSLSTDAPSMLFHALLIQGLFCGLICGRMIYGKVLSGVFFSLVLAAVPWVVFTFLI